MLKRNESVLQLVEAVGNASMLLVDWDNPELDDQRPHINNECVGNWYPKTIAAFISCGRSQTGYLVRSTLLHAIQLEFFCQASSCPRSLRKLFKPTFTPLLALVKHIWNWDTQEVIFSTSEF